MSTSVSSVVKGSAAQQTPNTVAEPDAFNKMDLKQFISLLVAEMQNQDPMNPMDNTEILQQVSQMRAIASNDKMTSTLTSLQLQQDMATASAMLHQTISGLNDSGDRVNGSVDKVSVAGGKVVLHVGDETVNIKNVSTVNGVGSLDQLETDIESANALMTQSVTGANGEGKSITGKVNKLTVSGNDVTLGVEMPGENDKMILDTIALGALTKINGIDSDAVLETYRQSGKSLVGQKIMGLNVEGKMVTGVVDKVAAAYGRIQLQVGSETVDLANVREINDVTTTATEE